MATGRASRRVASPPLARLVVRRTYRRLVLLLVHAKYILEAQNMQFDNDTEYDDYDDDIYTNYQCFNANAIKASSAYIISLG